MVLKLQCFNLFLPQAQELPRRVIPVVSDRKQEAPDGSGCDPSGGGREKSVHLDEITF